MHINIYSSFSRKCDPEPTVPLTGMQRKCCIPASGDYLLILVPVPTSGNAQKDCASPRVKIRSGGCIPALRECKRMCAVPQAVLQRNRSLLIPAVRGNNVFHHEGRSRRWKRLRNKVRHEIF